MGEPAATATPGAEALGQPAKRSRKTRAGAVPPHAGPVVAPRAVGSHTLPLPAGRPAARPSPASACRSAAASEPAPIQFVGLRVVTPPIPPVAHELTPCLPRICRDPRNRKAEVESCRAPRDRGRTAASLILGSAQRGCASDLGARRTGGSGPSVSGQSGPSGNSRQHWCCRLFARFQRYCAWLLSPAHVVASFPPGATGAARDSIEMAPS